MMFSPDFLHYFAQVARLYEEDPSIYCISSFNDNGFVGRIKDPSTLHRSDFFIGLGWMVSKKIFLKEWLPNWPDSHWDHFLRRDEIRKNRQCVYPEVPRNFNIGKTGTHVDDDFFERYLAQIELSKSVYVEMNVEQATSKQYSLYIQDLIDQAKPVSSLEDIRFASNRVVKIYYTTTSVLKKDRSLESRDRVWLDEISPFFGLWHEAVRGSYDWVHQFWFEDKLVLTIPNISKFYSSAVAQLNSSQFTNFNNGVYEFIIAAVNKSCTETCRKADKKCHVGSLKMLNNCRELEKNFKCSSCGQSNGKDQPAMEDDSNICLFHNGQDHTCSGYHWRTRRLCSCLIEPSKSIVEL